MYKYIMYNDIYIKYNTNKSIMIDIEYKLEENN